MLKSVKHSQNNKLNMLSLLNPIVDQKPWFFMSKQKLIFSHKRTTLGPLWILIHLIIFTGAMSLVYSGLFNLNFYNYVGYIGTGFMGWIWIANILSSSGMVYIEHSNIIKSTPIKLSNLVWSHCTYNLITFIYQIPLVIFFYLTGVVSVNPNLLYIIPSLLIVFAFNLAVSGILSVLIPRFRDIQNLITSSIVIIMITTPILWQPTMMSGARKLIYLLNPLYYIVEIIRIPLLCLEPNFNYYLISIGMTIFFLIIACFCYKNYAQSVVFRL